MRSTLVINQSMAGNNTLSVDIQNRVGFHPKKIIIRQLLYANIAGTDMGTYLLYSSLNNGYIGAIYVGIQSTPVFPETILDNPNAFGGIVFRLDPGHTSFSTPTGLLTMTLECLSE